MPKLATNATENLPTWHKLVPDHQGREDGQADEKIHERYHHRCNRYNQPWKVHLANKIGIREEAVRCLAHGGSKKAPGQHAGKDHKRIRRRAIRRLPWSKMAG